MIPEIPIISYLEIKIVLLAFFLLLGGVLLTGILFLFIKSKYFNLNQHENIGEIRDLILLASGGGYYFYYVSGEKEEELSDSLISMLSLSINCKTFEDIEEIFDDEFREKLVQSLEDLKSRLTKKVVLEGRVLIKGKELILSVHGNGVEDYKGNLVGVILWFFDITKDRLLSADLEKKLLSSLKKQEEYKSYLNLLPLPFWVRDIKSSDIFFYNSAYDKIVLDNKGKELEKIPCVYENLEKEADSLLSKGEVFYISKHLVMRGKRNLYDITEVPFSDSFSAGFLVNMSKYEGVKQELSDHVSNHSDLFENSSVGIAIYGKDTRLNFFNNAFTALWQLDEKWLNTKPLYQEVLENLRRRELLPENPGFGSIHDKKDKIFTNLIKLYNEFLNLPNGNILRIIVIPHAFGGLLFAYEIIHGDEAVHKKNAILHYELLNSISEGALLYNRDGFLEFFNKKFIEIFNLPEIVLKQKPHFSQLNKLISSMNIYDKDVYGDNLFTLKEMTQNEYFEKQIKLNNGKIINFIIKPLSEGNVMVSALNVCQDNHFNNAS